MHTFPRALICCIVYFLGFNHSFSQEIHVTAENSYELFAESLSNSKQIRYEGILKKYDEYIIANPNDIVVQLYKCKFIGNAFYDEYEDYDENWEDTESCLDKLYTDYPNNPGVILYKLEYAYGEDYETFILDAIEKYSANKDEWNYHQISELYEVAARYYTEDNDLLALNYAEKAERFSDSLDLSLLRANAHIRLGNRESAQEILMDALYHDSNAWQLNQKANLLVDLKEFDEALKMFDRVKEKDSSYINNSSLYKLFLAGGDHELARTYLVKDTINEWNKIRGLQKLLDHDIEYSAPEMALSTYRRVQEENYFDDILGIKRWKLFFKDPFLSLNFNEVSHNLIFILLIVIVFVLPYLWILPIHALGGYLRKKGRKIISVIPIDWSLKHFWLISFVYLIAQLLIVLVFYYQDYINHYFDISTTYSDFEILEENENIAKSLLLYSAIMFVSTLFFINRKRLQFIRATKFSFLRMISFGVAFVIFNSILLRILGNFIDLQEPTLMLESLSIQEDIKLLMENYGFSVSVLFIAIIVPFYEEVMFRGIILSSVEKNLGFIKANIIQAVLFAIVHFNFKLFIFYFIFGLITGYAVKRTNGLLTGIFLHAINNFFVLLLLYFLTRVMQTTLPY